MFTIASWNVNSVRSRLPLVLAWLKSTAPDIVLLQETKVTDDLFPRLEIEELGYNLALFGQKTYNGVAILSKFPLEDVSRGLPGDSSDEQARYIEATVSIGKKAVGVASIYVPNGQSPESDKFAYKLAFLDRLYAHAANILTFNEICILGGDYNVAPEAIDVYAPQALEGTTCFHPEERKRLRAILHTGWYDAFRSLHPDAHQYSWWDYRDNGWNTNKGMRIDHLLLSPQAADVLHSCEIQSDERAREKASDHAPILARFEG